MAVLPVFFAIVAGTLLLLAWGFATFYIYISDWVEDLTNHRLKKGHS